MQKRVPFVVFDWIGSMFSCVPFSMKGWIVVALLAMTMIPVDLLRKCITEYKEQIKLRKIAESPEIK